VARHASLVRLRAGLGACVCACLLLGAAASARAEGTDPAYPGSVLHVTTTGPRVANKVLTIVATGTNAPFGTPIDYGLRVLLIDPTLLPGPCKQSFNAEETDWENNPQDGRLLTFADLNEGLSGPFTITLPITPGGPGRLLICAYTVLVTDDAAWASTEVTIASKPIATARPRIARSGNRLACSRGTWLGSPTSYAYRWSFVHGGRTLGRRGTLTVSNDLRRHTVQCAVTARNSIGRATVSSLPYRIS